MSKTLVKQILLQKSYWIINKSVALVYGIDVALFLSFLIDKHDQCVNDEEYFYVTKKDAEYQTGLTRYQQDIAVKILVDNGLIYARAFGLPPKMHYHIRYEQIAAFFENANNLLIKKRGENTEAELQNNSDTISKKFTNRAGKDLQNNITKNTPLKTKSIKNKVSVVTDTPPLESKMNLSEIPTGSESLESRANNLKGTIVENHFYENENLSLKEKTLQKKANSGGGGENSQSNVSKLTIDVNSKIAPRGINNVILDFIFLESPRIDTLETRDKFTEWHERRARETKGVRTCLHYQKIMREIANSDLELWEILEGLEMAYERAWIDLKIDWIKNRTRQKQKQQNGTSKLEQQKQYIADSPFFKGA